MDFFAHATFASALHEVRPHGVLPPLSRNGSELNALWMGWQVNARAVGDFVN